MAAALRLVRLTQSVSTRRIEFGDRLTDGYVAATPPSGAAPPQPGSVPRAFAWQRRRPPGRRLDRVRTGRLMPRVGARARSRLGGRLGPRSPTRPGAARGWPARPTRL